MDTIQNNNQSKTHTSFEQYNCTEVTTVCQQNEEDKETDVIAFCNNITAGVDVFSSRF